MKSLNYQKLFLAWDFIKPMILEHQLEIWYEGFGVECKLAPFKKMPKIAILKWPLLQQRMELPSVGIAAKNSNPVAAILRASNLK